MCSVAGGGKLLLSGLGLGLSLSSSPNDTTNNIAHSAASVRAENLDSNYVCSLGNTILSRCDGTSAVGSVPVTVLVDIILGDGFSPKCAALELNMVDVNAGIDYVDVDAVTTKMVVYVLGEGGKVEFGSMTNACETLINE